jgi:hypothetical protein
MKFVLNSAKKRLTIGLILIILLGGLGIYYMDNHPKNTQYSTTPTIISHYPLGQTVSITGTVSGLEPGGFVVNETYKGRMVYYHVISNFTVHPGDRISFLGVLGADYHVNLTQSIVVEGESFDFLILRSFVVVPFLIILFLVYWRFDREKLAFIRRK